MLIADFEISCKFEGGIDGSSPNIDKLKRVKRKNVLEYRINLHIIMRSDAES
jgi:hypothetical protein